MMRIGPQGTGPSGASTLSEADPAARRGAHPRGEEDIGQSGRGRDSFGRDGTGRDSFGREGFGREGSGSHVAGHSNGDLQGDVRERGRNAAALAQEAASHSAFEQSLKRAFGEAPDAGTPDTRASLWQGNLADTNLADSNLAEPRPTDGGAASGSATSQEASHEASHEAFHEAFHTSHASHASHASHPFHASGKRPGLDEDPASLVDAGTLKVLALAERAPGFALTPSPAVTDTVPAGSVQAIRIASLTQRIEDVVRAELYTGSGRPITLKLDLGDLVPGLMSVTVAMTPDGIDVTLARSAGEASPELLQAAQALADRLQTRFAKRVVRILDAPAAEGATSTSAASSATSLAPAATRAGPESPA